MALKTALVWSAAQSVLRLVVGFISIKVTAVYLGAPGLALVGQINNFMALAQGGVANAIQTGVIRFTAESEGDAARQKAVWRTGILLSLSLSAPLVVLVMVLAKPISRWLFDTEAYWLVVLVSGPCVLLAVLGYVLTGILNGLKRLREVSLVQILTILGSAAVFIPLAYVWGIWGGLIGSALATTIALLISVPFLLRDGGVLHWRDLRGGMDRKLVGEFWGFFPMLLANSAVAPLGLIWVRDALSGGLGMDAAGHWQAMWRVSEMYTMVLTTALGLYLMPHLSSCKTDGHFARELFKITYQVAAITLLAVVVLYPLRDVVVSLVFTPDFYPVTDLFAWQLAGDVLKMISWPLRMALVIKKRVAWYIVLEAVAPLIHAGLTHMLWQQWGVNAATLGYAASYLVVDLLLLVALRDYFAKWRAAREGVE